MHDAESTDSPTELPCYGSYQVLHLLGSGGMSSIYKAIRVQTGHEVVLKVLPPAKAGKHG